MLNTINVYRCTPRKGNVNKWVLYVYIFYARTHSLIYFASNKMYNVQTFMHLFFASCVLVALCNGPPTPPSKMHMIIVYIVIIIIRWWAMGDGPWREKVRAREREREWVSGVCVCERKSNGKNSKYFGYFKWLCVMCNHYRQFLSYQVKDEKRLWKK